jgi:predicted RNA-binding Zn ribbon-like protein
VGRPLSRWRVHARSIVAAQVLAEQDKPLDDARAEPSRRDRGSARWQLPADGGQALSTIARDAVDLFSGTFADRIRECAADCYLIFVDA